MIELVVRRKARGWTAKQMAETVGISPQYLNDIEHGRRLPGVVMMYRIADVLECDPIDVFELELRPVGIRRALSAGDGAGEGGKR